jgi:hypothetical protein
MRIVYEMGLMLTFILLCISTMQFIVVGQLTNSDTGLMMGNASFGQKVNLNWTADTNFAGTQNIFTWTGVPGAEFIGGLFTVSSKLNNLWDLAIRFATGWQGVLKGIFVPEYGLSGIADLLIIVFDLIMIITMIYFVGNMISAVRGGGFS